VVVGNSASAGERMCNFRPAEREKREERERERKEEIRERSRSESVQDRGGRAQKVKVSRSITDLVESRFLGTESLSTGRQLRISLLGNS
jgi:hypothetical protein